jgi:uncharacterized protein YwqG
MTLTADEWSAYAELRADWRGNQPIHQLLGHADAVQPYAMEGRYEELRATLFDSLPPWDQLTPAAQRDELVQGRLLLQVDAQNNDMWWGRSGRLFFFIRAQDLAARDFGRVWAVEQ